MMIATIMIFFIFVVFVINIIIFVVSLWFQVAILIALQYSITGRPSGGIVGAGSIGAIITSFLLAKKINNILKSKIKSKD